MPITMMTSANTETGLYPDGAFSDLHWSSQRCMSRLKPGKTYGDQDAYDSITPIEAGSPIVLCTTHVGLVLSLHELNGRDDSDFVAVVWNEEKGAAEEITYATTRGWTYPNGASVDASAEIVVKVDALRERHRAAQIAAKARQDAATPTKGKTVVVVKGKKLPKGTTGTVVYYGKDKFDRSNRYSRHYPTLNNLGIYEDDARSQKEGFRVGIQVPGMAETVFIAATNVNVVREEG